MVAVTPTILLYLLASSPNSNQKKKKFTSSPKNSSQRLPVLLSDDEKKNKTQRIGRSRYSRSGDKIESKTKKNRVKASTITRTTRTSARNKIEDDNMQLQLEVNPIPPLTSPSSKRPMYFTCRHTFEHTLINEIQQFVKRNGDNLDGTITAISPYPGLVRVDDEMSMIPSYYDPVYALQIIPDAVVVSGDSIKSLARSIYESLLGKDNDEEHDNFSQNEQSETDGEALLLFHVRQKLSNAPRGSLSIHVLVPGMCKGQLKPVMLHRSEKVGEEVTKMLQKRFAAARKKPSSLTIDNDNILQHDENDCGEEKWLLQIMLQTNTIAIASLAQCKLVGPGNDAFWPNWHFPLGLANVNIEERMPSSAYRKLMEGLECMRIYPTENSSVVDLGACPGGWTSVIRRLGSTVTAVDRSEIDESLMKDDKVLFVKGDAFTFFPDDTNGDEFSDRWMISDVIAYPERCTELLDNWCNRQLVNYMIVTMKFQGDEPDLVELENAIAIVNSHGYKCRVKHFFNNKNEVTLMIAEGTDNKSNKISPSPLLSHGTGNLGQPMYPRMLPKI
jgi:hypothetical protein